jgi:hypothetical protein
MTVPWMYPSGIFSLAAHEIINPTAAWLLVVAFLALSCAALWFLSAPARHMPSEHSGPTPPRGTHTARGRSRGWTKHPPIASATPLAHGR